MISVQLLLVPIALLLRLLAEQQRLKRLYRISLISHNATDLDENRVPATCHGCLKIYYHHYYESYYHQYQTLHVESSTILL